MEIYFIKSAACLVILLLFYKLLLEKENMHVIKRVYLLIAAFASIIIPLITFTTYVEPVAGNFEPVVLNSSEKISSTSMDFKEYLPYIFWIIYFSGVLFFSIKFIRNLKDLVSRIRKNPQIKRKRFTNVLLSEKVSPHTFFSYIFLNKLKYERQEIPREVLVHEEAHALQKHSIDILLVEVFQIIFWLNPFIFILKKSVKLNHEFLADQAVIQQGVSTLEYQQTLLSFSSGELQSELVNPINYSSIKKRFTVMKTKTSKKTIWVRSLLLLPLIALLFYGFSDKAVVVKDSVDISNTLQDTIPGKKLTLHIEEEIIIVNGKITNLRDFAKSVNETTSDWTKEDFDLHGLEIQVADGVENTLIDKINTEFRKTNMAKASVSNSSYIPYSRSLTFPVPETPPAPPKMENYLNVKSKIYLEGKIISPEEANELINTIGKELNVSILENGKNKPIITMEFKNVVPPEPPKAPSLENGNLYMVAQAPPPPNSNTLEYIKELARRGAKFYIGPHKYSPEEVIKMVKKSTNEISIDVSQYPEVRLGGC